MMGESKLSQLLTENKTSWWIFMDHSYARPSNLRPEAKFLKPTKTLFMTKIEKCRRLNPLQIVDSEDEGEIDIEKEDDEGPLIYDKLKAKDMMEDVEKHAALARVHEADNENWEANICMDNWGTIQRRLFTEMVKILHSHNLGKLAFTDHRHEAICRRALINKSVSRVRKIYAELYGEIGYCQWLNRLLLDNLNSTYLGYYLDILQTLRSKLPNLVDKIMSGPTTVNHNKLSLLSNESLFPLLKRPWDPIAQSLVQEKPKKIPSNPILIVMPSAPFSSKRAQKWTNLLSTIATTITVPINFSLNNKMTVVNYVDQLFASTRMKIQEVKAEYPGRNIVLVGFNCGATLGLQIAHVEQVMCVICLGFSLDTAEGRRGEPDDNLLELQCPALFVIGECANTANREDMESLRERMRVETGMVVVGSADDCLRISTRKKCETGLTQRLVDRLILDEIADFISGVILSPFPPQFRQSPTIVEMGKKLKTERKRYNSTNSSLDSEPASPTPPRIHRPVGRPPGSKSKNKVESRWTTSAQIIAPAPSTSPPPCTFFSTPDTSSNDSFQTDKTNSNSADGPPIKKLKTLKPSISPLIQSTTLATPITTLATTPTVKYQGLPTQGRTTLSSLLQGDLPASKFSGANIKILENVKLNSASQKFLANTGKVPMLTKTNCPGSLVLLPDGKFKTIAPPASTKEILGRYITSRRQVIGNQPARNVKRITYGHAQRQPHSQPQTTSNLMAPTTLTTQDILDLPIIFADDNQMITETNQTIELQPQVIAPPMVVTTTTAAAAAAPGATITTIMPVQQAQKIAGNKVVLVNNKPQLQSSPNFIITPSLPKKIQVQQRSTLQQQKPAILQQKSTVQQQQQKSTLQKQQQKSTVQQQQSTVQQQQQQQKSTVQQLKLTVQQQKSTVQQQPQQQQQKSTLQQKLSVQQVQQNSSVQQQQRQTLQQPQKPPPQQQKFPLQQKAVPAKIPKVVVSAKKTTPILLKKNIEITNLSPEISVKKVPAKVEIPPPLVEEMDLENEIASSTVFKSGSNENITIITNKKGETIKSIIPRKVEEKQTTQKHEDYIIIDDN